mmetsp:Transcript_21874/g.26354  ORF Transcript_21874/g.26354 Transcript_21874/m.26354 type:complete len:97 (-) Transcript_21874:15-305(-)
MQLLDWSLLDKGVLYDRTEEKKKLIAAFDRRIFDQSTGEFILLSGKSGTGKTSLAKVLRKHVARKRGFFISGKFDQQVSTSLSLPQQRLYLHLQSL